MKTDGAVHEVLREAKIVVAYLFGSRARGEAREGSDVDIAVLAGRTMGLMEQEILRDRLIREMGVPDVDLLVLDDASLQIRGRVVQEGRPIFSADEPARVAFEVRTRAEYLDFLPVLTAHTKRVLHQVATNGLDRG